MKSTHLLLTITALALSLPASLQAGSKDPAKKEAKQAAKAVLDQYDKDANGSINGDEVAAVQKAYTAEPNGSLKKFDLNADGKLDDTEAAAIHAGKKGAKKKNL